MSIKVSGQRFRDPGSSAPNISEEANPGSAAPNISEQPVNQQTPVVDGTTSDEEGCIPGT